jgi:hypothetical protein
VANVEAVIGSPASVSASAAALRRKRAFGSVGIAFSLWFARNGARWHEKTRTNPCNPMEISPHFFAYFLFTNSIASFAWLSAESLTSKIQ